MCACEIGTCCITTRVVVQVLVCKGWKLRNFPPSGAFSSEVGYRKSQMNEMCDIFIMCFVLFLFVTCFVWNLNAIVVMEVEEEGGRAEEEEVSLGVIMTNIEIKFHILLFTLSSSSVSQSLSFNLLQSLYCPLSSVLVLCLQIKVWSVSVLSIRIDSGSLLFS